MPETSDPAFTGDGKAFWITGPRQAAIKPVRLRALSKGEVLVQTLYSGISRGTESLVFSGRVPESQWREMRAPLQDGDFPFPVKYGYITVGVVRDGPADLAGKTVFCLHPHQERFLAPASMVHPIPDTVPAGRAVLAANMETAITISWDAGVGAGDRVTVIGAGVVGFLVAWLASRIPGVTVHLVDPDRRKAPAASALGLKLLTPEEAAALPFQDRVIHTSANPAGLRQALTLAGMEATIIEASWYGTTEPALPLGEAFHSRRLTIRSSQVGHISPDRLPRWDFGRRMRCALSLLDEPRLDALITGESQFDDLPQTLAELTDNPDGVLMHRICYTA